MSRPGQAREIPPPLELLCLKALWSLQEGNVADVRRVVAENRNLAYTTVMTVLERLVRRSLVSRRKVGRSFVYAPEMSRDAVRVLALKELVDCFFNGSKEQLMAFLQSGERVEERSLPARLENGDEGRLETALL